MMHVVDGLDFGMLLHRHRVEAGHLAHLHEGRLQSGERLHGGRGPHVLVFGQDCQPVDVLDRDDRILETPLLPRLSGALLALDRVGIDVVAREAVFGGDQVGGDTLRQEIGLDRDRGIHRPGAAGSADADAAHQLDAAAHGHLVLARHDLGGGEIDRIEAGGTEAVDLHAGHAVAEARHQRGGARDVAAGFPHRIDAAQHHVVDELRVELVAVLDGGERLRRQIERGHLVQRAVGLAAAARGAHGIVDECVGHVGFLHPVRRRPRESGDPYAADYRETAAYGSRASRYALARDDKNYRLRAISSFMISLVPRRCAARARRGRAARSDIRPCNHSRRTIAGSGRSHSLACRSAGISPSRR